MDNTTEQTNMQGELTPEEAKASLGLATRLGEQHLMSMVPQEAVEAPVEGQEGSQTQQEAPKQESPKEDNSAQIEGKMDEKMEILRTELKDTIKVEIESIRKDIKDALENEED